MIDKVYLLWHAYATKELLLIGSLTKIENKYIFKYEKDAVKAKNFGCFLPFPYTEDKLYFDSLPSFFAQRMLTSEYNVNKFGINLNDELALLTYYDGIKNSDNFRIVNAEIYSSLIDENYINDEQNIKQSQYR